jgi:hypothetical protein
MVLTHRCCGQQEPYLIEVGGIISGSGLKMSPHTVEMKQGRYWHVTEGWSENKGQVQLRDTVAVPALRDAHIHLSDSDSLASLLLYGVCEVRDLGSPLSVASSLSRASGNCGNPMPAVELGGPIFDQPGSRRLPSSLEWTEEEDLWRSLVDARDRGARWVKLYGAFPETLAYRFVRRAHALGLHVAAHARPSTIRAVLDAGVDEIQHLSTLLWLLREPPHRTPDVHTVHQAWAESSPSTTEAQKLAEILGDTGLCPTLAVHEQLLEGARSAWNPEQWPEQILTEWRRAKVVSQPWEGTQFLTAEKACRAMANCLGVLREAGVNVAVGSDTPNPGLLPGESLWHEINQFMRSGMPKMDALLLSSVNMAGMTREGNFDLAFLAESSMTGAGRGGLWPPIPVAGVTRNGCLFVNEGVEG